MFLAMETIRRWDESQVSLIVQKHTDFHAQSLETYDENIGRSHALHGLVTKNVSLRCQHKFGIIRML